jgi:hypothetical protein
VVRFRHPIGQPLTPSKLHLSAVQTLKLSVALLCLDQAMLEPLAWHMAVQGPRLNPVRVQPLA